MRREVLAVSGAAARRLLRVRVAESAAVAATAAGLCSGAVQVAWLTAAVALPASVGICVLVAAGGVLPLLPPVRRALRLGGGVAGCLAGICLAAGVAGAACVLSGWHARVGQVVVPAVLFPLGGLVGAAVAAVRGVSPRRAAGELDARCRLAEQLATATELAESPPPEGPAWLCVYERALAAVRGSGAARGRMWSRTGATPGALLLTALLCAILSFVPPFGHIHDGDLAEFAAAVEEMPLARRMRLARSLRAAAGSDPKVAEMLAGAAAAVEDRDAGRLAGLFRRLRAAGVEPMSVVPPGLARVDFGSLLVGGMLLAGLGAVMDVSMAVASTVSEVHRAAPDARGWALFGPGLAAGRDILGVMVFTLALVFVGGQLMFFVSVGQTGWADRWLLLANYEELAAELARVAAAGLGMAVCVPAAAGAAALLYRRRREAA